MKIGDRVETPAGYGTVVDLEWKLRRDLGKPRQECALLKQVNRRRGIHAEISTHVGQILRLAQVTFVLEHQQRSSFGGLRMHQKLLVRSPFPLVLRNVSTGQKIFTEEVIGDQAHTGLIGQRKTPPLIQWLWRSRGNALRMLNGRCAATRAQRRH